MILVDAGPLVALIHADDQHHQSCRAAFRKLREPLATTWPVLTEAMYLLGFSWVAQEALWKMTERGAVVLMPLEAEDIPRMRLLMHKYRDLPMDMTDASLVRLAEREKLRRVFTLDRRHFSIYRPSRIGRFSVIP